MSYLEKLIKLEGRKPQSLTYHAQILNKKNEEEAAKSMFKLLITIPKEKAKAKKLGLI